MVNWLLAATAASSFVGGLNIALFVFFHTKDFDDEYGAKNQKLVSKLIQEFKRAMDEWAKRSASVSDEEKLSELLPELQELSAIGGQIERWNSRLTEGKGMIHKAAGSILAAGVLLAIGFAILAGEDPELLSWVVLAVLSGVGAGAYAYGFMTAYLRLTKAIDRQFDSLSLGRPVMESDYFF